MEAAEIRPRRNWELRSYRDNIKANELASELNISLEIANLLIQRGIDSFESAKRFFRPSMEHLHDPMQMLDMAKAVERIKQAVHQKEGILIYGDYDVDGTTAVALLYSSLKTVHQGALGYYIPDRYAEGYGISFRGIDYAHQNGYSVIVALDCGIRSIDKIKYASEKKIDFIICDHHIPGEEVPEAIAVLNPKRSDCPYPYKELSGCGIGFKLIQALSIHAFPELKVEEHLDLVALSIAADIVPITGENRVLAYFGLQKINAKPKACFQFLLKAQKERSHDKETTISDLVFKVAPKINAAGRIEHGSKAVEILVCESPADVEAIGSFINATNERRRDIDLQMTSEAFTIIENNPDWLQKKSTVLYQPDWHKGVVGIVASRVLERYYKPTVILSLNDGIITGSARSIKGFDIHAAFSQCADLLLQFGGHAFAAGLSLKPEMLDAFINRFEQIASATLSDSDMKETIEIDLELEPAMIDQKFYRILKQFAPFGPGNMAPVILSKGLIDDGTARIVGNNHLKLRLGKKGQPYFDSIAFGRADLYSPISKGIPCDVCYTLDENHWNGKVTLQWMIKDMEV